jgi:hypothetical protein
MGRNTKSTLAQRAEVVRLAAAGVSVRAIAAEVFGEVRFRGRVERILAVPVSVPDEASAGSKSEGGVRPEAFDFTGLSHGAAIRLLFERRLADLGESGEAPSVTEVRGLLDVLRRLEALEAVERIKAITSRAFAPDS